MQCCLGPKARTHIEGLADAAMPKPAQPNAALPGAVLRLGVWIDVVLLVGAVALLVLVVHPEAGSLPSAASEG